MAPSNWNKIIAGGAIVLKPGDQVTDMATVNYSPEHIDRVKFILQSFDAFARNGKSFANSIVGKHLVVTDLVWGHSEDSPARQDPEKGEARVKFVTTITVNDGASLWILSMQRFRFI